MDQFIPLLTFAIQEFDQGAKFDCKTISPHDAFSHLLEQHLVRAFMHREDARRRRGLE